MHFTGIHPFALFGLKEHSRAQNLGHEEGYVEAPGTAADFCTQTLYPAAAILWVFGFQRTQSYRCFPPCHCGEAFLCKRLLSLPKRETVQTGKCWVNVGKAQGASYLGRPPEFPVFLQQFLSLLWGLSGGGMR